MGSGMRAKRQSHVVMIFVVLIFSQYHGLAMESPPTPRREPVQDIKNYNIWLRSILRNFIDIADNVAVSRDSRPLMQVSLPNVVDEWQAAAYWQPLSREMMRKIRVLFAQPGYILHWIAWFGYDDLFVLIAARRFLDDDQMALLLNAPLDINERIDGITQNLATAQIAPGDDGVRPLHLAIYRNCDELVRHFLNHDALLNVRTLSGRTPLHLALLRRDYRITQHLLKAGADPNDPLLLRADANPKIPHVFDEKIFACDELHPAMRQMMPLSFAVAYADLEMIMLLGNYGAKTAGIVSQLPQHHDQDAAVPSTSDEHQELEPDQPIALNGTHDSLHENDELDEQPPPVRSRTKYCCVIL